MSSEASVASGYVPPRKRFRPIQGLAILGIAIINVMATAALINLAIGHAPLPPIFHDWIAVTHLVLILTALWLTLIQLVLPKGTGLHLVFGYVWAATMIAAVSVSFGMHIINGGFSPPHGFSLATLIFVPLIIFLARTGRHETHRGVVLAFVLFFLVVAGAFTFKGDRALAQMFWSIWP